MGYKEEHEKFVSDLPGTTVGDIAVVVSSAAVAVLLRNVLIHSVFAQSVVNRKSLKFLLDFCVLILPVLLCFTVMADHVVALLSGLLTAVICIVMFNEQSVSKKKAKESTFETLLNENLPGDKRPFVSAYRAYVNIATAISILAVDFVIYPRRFAKAETFGSGLMDVGVGAFIVSNAIVSPEARGKHNADRTFFSKLSSIAKACKGCLPLIILGVVRLVGTKSTDYQEHVSEYGVHWNFFFTLTVVKVLSTILLCIIPPAASALLSLAIAVSYEYALTNWRLKDSIVSGFDGHDSREGFLNANREGIFSAVGYLSLYFAGIVIGQYLFRKRSTLKQWLTCLFTLAVMTQGFYLLLIYGEVYIDAISRRMANLPFIIWMIAYNLQTLTSFCLVEIVVYLCQKLSYLNSIPEKGSTTEGSTCLLEAVNRNGLLYFLLANLFTGLVNMSMQTIYATPSVGFCVVLAYMFVLSLITYCLHLKDITTRFW